MPVYIKQLRRLFNVYLHICFITKGVQKQMMNVLRDHVVKCVRKLTNYAVGDTFCGTSNPLLLSFLLGSLKWVHTKFLFYLGLFVISWLSIKLIQPSREYTRLSYQFLVCSFLVCSNIPLNILLVMIFHLSAQVATTKKKYFISGIFLGLALSSDRSSLLFFVPILILTFQHFISFAINPYNCVWNIFKMLFSIIIYLLILPFSTFVLLFSADLAIRKLFSAEAARYSLYFQFSLQNFKFGPHFFSKKIINKIKYEPTDKYVMDRSVISIMNIKHRRFIEYSGKDSASTCQFEIRKVYAEDNEKSNDRFIIDQNIVKIVEVNSGDTLGIPENTQEPKLYDATFGTFAGDRDLWVLECEKNLSARETVFKLRNAKTGLFLGARMLKTELLLHGSIYSEKSSREFIIATNTNHEYYATLSDDSSVWNKTESFPALPFLHMLYEHSMMHLTSNLTNNFIFSTCIFHVSVLINLFFILLSLLFRYFYKNTVYYTFYCNMPIYLSYTLLFILISSFLFNFNLSCCYLNSLILNLAFVENILTILLPDRFTTKVHLKNK